LADTPSGNLDELTVKILESPDHRLAAVTLERSASGFVTEPGCEILIL
jgi:hypothetical protein